MQSTNFAQALAVDNVKTYKEASIAGCLLQLSSDQEHYQTTKVGRSTWQLLTV
jgi:hypothetical protein